MRDESVSGTQRSRGHNLTPSAAAVVAAIVDARACELKAGRRRARSAVGQLAVAVLRILVVFCPSSRVFKPSHFYAPLNKRTRHFQFDAAERRFLSTRARVFTICSVCCATLARTRCIAIGSDAAVATAAMAAAASSGEHERAHFD